MHRGDFNLTPTQILLLKAAVFPVDEALVFWQAWKISQGLTDSELMRDSKMLERVLDPLDRASYRLIPLVYRNLESTADPIVRRLRGNYRHSWMRNQQQLHWYGEAARTLHEAGIETICIKGLAMSLLYYQHMGVRYMNDIDLLIPYEQLDKAIQVLVDNKKLGLTISALGRYSGKGQYASHLYSHHKFDLDLHRHLLARNYSLKADDVFWADSQPLPAGHGIST